MKYLLYTAIAFFVLWGVTLQAQYIQNFDGLPTTTVTGNWSNNSTLTGWYAFRTAGVNPPDQISAGTGSSNSGALYSFGASGSSERALGLLGSNGVGNQAIGVVLTNATGANIVNPTIRYRGEQWRDANTNGDTLYFAYSVVSSLASPPFDATTSPTGFTAVTALNFSSPVNLNTGTAGIDGNTVGASVRMATLTGVTVTPGQFLILRWFKFNEVGNDHGLGIDSLSVSGNLSVPAPPPTAVSFAANAFLQTSEDSASFLTRLVNAIQVTNPATAGSVQLSFVDNNTLLGTGTQFDLGTTTDITITDAPITVNISASGARTVAGTGNITITNDAMLEYTEVATIKLVNPTGVTITPGADSLVLVLHDNDVPAPTPTRELTFTQLTSYVNNQTIPAGPTLAGFTAEISAFDTLNQVILTVNGSSTPPVVNVLEASDLLGGLSPIDTFQTVTPANSVAVRGGIAAIAIQANPSQNNGRVEFRNVATGAVLGSVAVGALPDMLTFNATGTKVLVANEGEPLSYSPLNDPEGSVTIINVTLNPFAIGTVVTASLAGLNGQATALRAAGVRLFGTGSTVAQDLEPEYIAVPATGDTAYAICQENNAIIPFNMNTGALGTVTALGAVNYLTSAANKLDASDQSVNIFMGNWPLQGLRQPDATVAFSVGGTNYLLTANEGDARSYTGLVTSDGDSNEEERVSGTTLDPTVFRARNILQQNQLLGRLNVSDATGSTDGDAELEVLQSFGSRSFTLFNATTKAVVYESGSLLENIIYRDAALRPFFNVADNGTTIKNRSDDAGPEPEAVAVGQIGTKTYAFIGPERLSGVFCFDITTPAAPVFVDYFTTRSTTSGTTGDRRPEDIKFVSAAESPTGVPLLIVSNESSNGSGTVQVIELTESSLTPDYVTLSPANESENVPVTSNFVITFNKPVVKGTGNLRLFNNNTGAVVETIDVTSAAVTIASDRRTVTINPSNDLASASDYVWDIPAGAFRDTRTTPADYAGFTAASGEWLFSTGTFTATEVPEALRELRIAPNPVAEELRLEGNVPGANSITTTVVGMDGRTLGTTTLPVSSQRVQGTVRVAQLATGVYILRVNTPDGQQRNLRFVKQ